jgi:uncharacterized DUF497 family protein
VFTWDVKKRKLNLAKHGIDFHDATIIFDGPLVTVEDTREDYGEPRLEFSPKSSYRSPTRSVATEFESFLFARR